MRERERQRQRGEGERDREERAEGEEREGDGEPEPEPAPDPDPAQLPYCPDAERIFSQFRESKGEIPLCSKIDPAHRCHKQGGPDTCPLLDRPEPAPAEKPPMMGVNENPPRRTRRKRGES